MIQCTRIEGCWTWNASSKSRASCSVGGYWGWGAGLGGRCFVGPPCFLRAFACLYHARSSGAGGEKTKPTGREIGGAPRKERRGFVPTERHHFLYRAVSRDRPRPEPIWSAGCQYRR